MGITRDAAFILLEVPTGSDPETLKKKYKQLALKWLPEKHKNAPNAVKHFRQITQAYRLLTYNNPEEMTMAEARRFFQDVYFSNSSVLNGASDDSTSSDDESDESDEEEDKLEQQFGSFFPGKVKRISKKKECADGLSDLPHLTAEEINRNAEELITEEERERKKAEKRRAKKKRRKERKKQEKQEQKTEKSKKSKNKGQSELDKNKKTEKKSGSGSSSDEQADFDPTSAFFTKAVSKKKKSTSDFTQPSKKDKMHERNGATHNGEEDFEEVDSTVLRSRQLAIRGNEMAQVEEYNAAIQLFTEAISLDPKDFRFLGNRSYCFDRLQQYEKALKDAEKAIKLSKDWPKGYFRKGRALAGLNKFSEAEEAFLQVLKLDKNCEEAVQELQQVRTRQLTDMGFSQSQALAAIKKYATVQAALEALLAGTGEESIAGEVYLSDEEDYSPSKNIPASQSAISQSVDAKMDPKNPEGLTALWVGNVLPQVTERRLTQMFSKYGPVVSVRMLPEKYCAFINFKLKESAGRAMQCLQNQECEGQHLLIRFPDNPINPTLTLRKTTTTTTTPANSPSATKGVSSGVRNTPKLSGPVNGDECYFWRTTGCDYGDACRYKHLPKSKGADKKPWQK